MTTVAEEAAELKHLVGNLAVDSGQLLREEAELAKRELREEVARAKRKAISASVGGAVLLLGAAFLLIAVTGLLALVMPMWLAAAIVGGATSLVGGVLLERARRIEDADLIPEHTLHRVERDVRAVREAVR